MFSPSKEKNIMHLNRNIYFSYFQTKTSDFCLKFISITGGREKSGSGYRDSRSATTSVSDSRGKKGGRGVDASFAGRGTGWRAERNILG